MLWISFSVVFSIHGVFANGTPVDAEDRTVFVLAIIYEVLLVAIMSLPQHE